MNMKHTLRQILKLIPVALTLSSGLLQAEIIKQPDQNTLWKETGINVKTIRSEIKEFWGETTWMVGGKWLSDGLYLNVTEVDKKGLLLRPSQDKTFTSVRVPYNLNFPYLVWDVVHIVPGEGYRELRVGLDAPNFDSLSVIGNLQLGTFLFNTSLKNPTIDSMVVPVAVHLHNAELTINGLRMVAEPENNLTLTSDAFYEKQRLDINDQLTITLTLARPVEGARVEFFDRNLVSSVRLNDQEDVQLKAVDTTKKVWSAKLDVKSLFMPNLKKGEQIAPNRLLFKATTTGGGLSLPLWTGNPYEFNLNLGLQVMGAPKFAAGKHGQALNFDGKSDSLVIPSTINEKEGTMECWIYVSPALEKTANIFRIDGTNPWGYHELSVNGDTFKLSYKVHSGGKESSVTSNSIGTGWHHVMATYSLKSGRIELFVDGKREGSADYTSFPTTFQGRPLGIGGYILGKVQSPYAGLIDEIRISNVVRPAPVGAPGPFKVDKDTVVLIQCDRASGIKNAVD